MMTSRLLSSASEWTCDALFTASTGDFASPRWPENYPNTIRCTWRIRAQEHQRVRLYFTQFDLALHHLNHCNDVTDHVKVLDGGSINSPQIGSNSVLYIILYT